MFPRWDHFPYTVVNMFFLLFPQEVEKRLTFSKLVLVDSYCKILVERMCVFLQHQRKRFCLWPFRDRSVSSSLSYVRWPNP